MTKYHYAYLQIREQKHREVKHHGQGPLSDDMSKCLKLQFRMQVKLIQPCLLDFGGGGHLFIFTIKMG